MDEVVEKTREQNSADAGNLGVAEQTPANGSDVSFVETLDKFRDEIVTRVREEFTHMAEVLEKRIAAVEDELKTPAEPPAGVAQVAAPAPHADQRLLGLEARVSRIEGKIKHMV